MSGEPGPYEIESEDREPPDELAEAEHAIKILRTERDRLRAANKAYAETILALENGQPAPHYCAYCMTEIKRGGDPDHMIACKDAPYGKLTQQLVDAIGHVRALLGYMVGFDNCSEEAVAARAWLEKIDP